MSSLHTILAEIFCSRHRQTGRLVGVRQHLVLASVGDHADALLDLAEPGRQEGPSNNSGAKRSGGTPAGPGTPHPCGPVLSWDSSRTVTRAAARRTNKARADTLCSFARNPAGGVMRAGQEVARAIEQAGPGDRWLVLLLLPSGAASVAPFSVGSEVTKSVPSRQQIPR